MKLWNMERAALLGMPRNFYTINYHTFNLTAFALLGNSDFVLEATSFTRYCSGTSGDSFTFGDSIWQDTATKAFVTDHRHPYKKGPLTKMSGLWIYL